MTKLMNFRDTQ